MVGIGSDFVETISSFVAKIDDIPIEEAKKITKICLKTASHMENTSRFNPPNFVKWLKSFYKKV